MNILKNKKALSTVVTTLIILVVSVLLATVVTFYAINVTTTRVQEESLFLTKPHVWYSTTDGRAQGALVIINTGGRDVVIDKITARGQEKEWTGIYYSVTSGSISADLEYSTTLSDGVKILIGGKNYTFTQGSAGKDITLKSGQTMIVYIDQPDSIALNDVGTTVGLTVFSANAQYYKEANVQASE